MTLWAKQREGEGEKRGGKEIGMEGSGERKREEEREGDGEKREQVMRGRRNIVFSTQQLTVLVCNSGNLREHSLP